MDWLLSRCPHVEHSASQLATQLVPQSASGRLVISQCGSWRNEGKSMKCSSHFIWSVLYFTITWVIQSSVWKWQGESAQPEMVEGLPSSPAVSLVFWGISLSGWSHEDAKSPKLKSISIFTKIWCTAGLFDCITPLSCAHWTVNSVWSCIVFGLLR